MRDIPKHIRDRCTFETKDQQTRVVDIQPVDPCEHCHRTLTEPQVSRIHIVGRPFAHWREQCMTCKRLRMANTDTWFDTPYEINMAMQTTEFKKTLKV
jgi:hypothetical protein